MDDKRQMTVLLACTKSGKLLPPQLVYQGKTDASHPQFNFPDDWDVTHTDTHWSTTDSMKRYVENVIIPYIDRTVDENDMPLRQHALCVFDVYAAHRGEELLNMLKGRNVHVVFVPASCTDKLQPLDLGLNAPFKQSMKAEFEDFYANSIAEQMHDGDKQLTDVHVDLRLSVVKPLHAKWLVKTHEELNKKTTLIQNAWSMAGIV